MKKQPLPKIALVFVALLVAACTATPPSAPLPEQGFDHLAPIKFKVAAVEIASEYRPPLAAPNVDHRFPTTPADAVRKWAQHRLVAAGGSAQAHFVVIDASVVEKPVERKLSGLQAIFTTEVSVDYRAHLVARLTIDDVPGQPGGTVEVVASRNMTVLENVSLAEREQVWFDMTEALMADFDREMESQIRRALGSWITE